MKFFKHILKKKYQLSNYQIAQLTFLFKTLFSEFSKILIMGIIFYKNFPLYIFALIIMLILRCSTGGIHFYTYTNCFIASLAFLILAVIVFPKISLPLYIQIFLLIICILICHSIGPIPSKYRPAYTDHFEQKCKVTISIFIFFYVLFLYIIPNSKYSITGFWIIILHSLQLILAKYIRKEI